MSPVSRVFIRKQLRSLNANKAIGLDGISSRFLRDAADVLVDPVSHLINLSILTETVPQGFKQAKVIPLYKKGSRMDPGNYRPVSVLSVLSKILEHAVDSQLKEYLEKKQVLFSKQSGFRSRFSTDTCLIGLSDYVKGEMAQGNLVGMVLIDLQKAFDTVDHGILCSKLQAIGVTSVSWFQSYLSDRQQCVEIDGVRSDFLNVSCGVPQGSILGPQLFLLYINDLSISIDCDLLLYADDSALIFSHKDPNFIARHLSDQLSSCKKWLTDNRLSLHVGKTETILFGSCRRLKKVESFQVTCESVPVKRVHSVKYLGVLLDESMDGKSHANGLVKKCGSRVSFLYRNRSFLNTKTRTLLCSALIQPLIDYCSSSWYELLSKQLKQKLDVIQRRMIRFVFSMHHMEHVDSSHFSNLSWLTVRDRVDYFKLCHVFKIRVGRAPPYMTQSFIPVSSTHSHATRGSCAYNFSLSHRTATVPNTFSFSAIKAWNGLPSHLKGETSERVFKSKLKSLFFAKY